jgi:hypothetical protein
MSALAIKTRPTIEIRNWIKGKQIAFAKAMARYG